MLVQVEEGKSLQGQPLNQDFVLNVAAKTKQRLRVTSGITVLLEAF